MSEKFKKLSAAVCAAVFSVSCLSLTGVSAEETFLASDVAINSTAFPDSTFRSYVSENFDKNGNGYLSLTERNAVTEIEVDYMSIGSLKGVEYFSKLKTLYCSENNLTEIDLSKNTALDYLDCGMNKLTKLDVTANTALTGLYCYGNRLTSLDVSKNTSLEALSCFGNYYLKGLDLTQNKQLKELFCYDNSLTSLDLRNNTALNILSCGSNCLTSLDLSNNKALRTMDCSNNKCNIGTVSGSYPLSKLPGSFNSSKASNWTGATYDKASDSLKNFTSSTVTYSYDLGNGSSEKFTLAATLSAAPAKPAFSSLTPGVNSMVLRWNAVSGAKSYRVYYRVYGTTKWSYKNTTKNAMNLTGLTGGRKYDFAVRAYNGSAWSAFSSADIKRATPKAANKPVISSAVPGVNSVVLRWNTVSSAAMYRVYYRVNGTSKWSYKNTTKNAMNLTGLTGGKTYQFVVRAYNGSTWTAFTSSDIVKAAIKS